jgi:DNA-binding beta-propeller fold protein YncE
MTLLNTIPGFAGTVPVPPGGCNTSGPTGVVAIPQLHQLYVGDGNSTVKVVDTVAQMVINTIPTGGNCRADELAYDAADHIIVIANDQDSPPFLTFISTDTQSFLGSLTYPPSQTGHGLEQPVWNPKNNRFYQAVPQIPGTNTGSIDIINPLTRKVERSLNTGCSPAGLVLTPSQRLKTSCGETFDAITGDRLGRTEAEGKIVLADQLWYNPGDNHYYFGFIFNPAAGFNGCAVVDANTDQLLTFIPASTHTLAADPNYNRIFIPVSGSGIQVWAAQ